MWRTLWTRLQAFFTTRRLSLPESKSEPKAVESSVVSDLRRKQSDFLRNVSVLIDWCTEQGYELTLDWGYRPRWAAELMAELGLGKRTSLHTQRLAVDLNLFIRGKYQEDLEAYRPLGEFWKSLDPENAWGGDFTGTPAGDARHFSRRHGGKA